MQDYKYNTHCICVKKGQCLTARIWMKWILKIMKHFKDAYMSIKINIGQILIFIFYMQLLTIISVFIAGYFGYLIYTIS